MNISMCEPKTTRTMMAIEPSQIDNSIPAEQALSEQVSGQLLRGEDAGLVERIGPLVLQSSVTLDLAGVDRIDAAGISMLVTLYSGASQAGHCFNVINASPRVVQILAVVGLDRLLVSHHAVQNSAYAGRFRRSAA
jgi:anti-anti-sigma factor